MGRNTFHQPRVLKVLSSLALNTSATSNFSGKLSVREHGDLQKQKAKWQNLVCN